MSNDIRVNRSEINRLNKAIAEEEQNINYAFQRIGQTYFATHRQDAEESQKANIQAVLDSMQRASTYKDQINVLRGIAICPNCKAEVDIRAAFCSCCGTKMPMQTPPASPAAPGTTICPNCGNVCAAGTRFCNQCGTRIPESAPAAPAPAYAAPAYAPIPEPTPAPAYAPIPEPTPAPAYAPIPEPVQAYSPIPEPVFQAPQGPAQTPVCNAGMEYAPAAAPEPAPAAEPMPEPAAEPMPEPAPAPEEPAPEEPVPEQPAAPAQKFCANCGTPLDPDYRFCLECGTPVQQ
jgi:hypothetical protein